PGAGVGPPPASMDATAVGCPCGGMAERPEAETGLGAIAVLQDDPEGSSAGAAPDLDGDGIPDTEDPDLDGDIVENANDNCEAVRNVCQRDTDEDSVGDLCDPDLDGDGIPNDEDPDLDGDGSPNEDDNCPSVPNREQEDEDEDGSGDPCDPDLDGDGIPNEEDPDYDVDEDGIPDLCDNCPEVANTDQDDSDQDGVGNACDNCWDVVNPDQQDSDGNCADPVESPFLQDPKCGDGCQEAEDEDACGDASLGAPCDGPDGDRCEEGEIACVEGEVVCTDTTGTSREVCNGVDDDCDGRIDEYGASGCTTYYRDVDNDGYGDVAVSGECLCSPGGQGYTEWTATLWSDCDDADPSVNPGMSPETNCTDGKDNDCDGAADCSDSDCYTDGDGDGHALPPCGYDCDDTNSSVHPAAPEVCDGVDNDCDGQADEGEPSGCTTYYRDLDGDGYGDASQPGRCLCSPGGQGWPDYTSTLNTDCDDTDSSVHPGVTETCNGIDDDCDGVADEGNPGGGAPCDGPDSDLCAEGIYECSGGAIICSDTTGDSVEDCTNGVDDDCDGAIDCSDSDCYTDGDGDGHALPPCGDDCDDGNSLVFPGATETCDGVDNDCDGVADEGNPGGGAPCDGPDSDFCQEGIIQCSGGALICSDTTGDSVEDCTNGIDDDCDGLTDSDDPDCGGP
ncbi:MAG: thrombospondin type 3 repeat-containing protein, partial [Candidatus Bipolaricaulota bacterium]